MSKQVLTVRTEPSNNRSDHRYLKLDLVCTQVLFALTVIPQQKKFNNISNPDPVFLQSKQSGLKQQVEVNKVVANPS